MHAAAGKRPWGRSSVEIHRGDLVWLLVVVLGLAGLGVAASLIGVPLVGNPPVVIPWWALAVLFYLAEVRAVHLQFQREAHSFTLSEIPLVLGLFCSTPFDIVVASVVGAGLGLLVHRRPAPIKLCFNIALFLLGPATAAVVFHRLVPSPDPLQPAAWLVAFVATAASVMLGLAAVNIAIWLAQGRSDRRRLGIAVRFGVLVAMTNTCLALFAITLLWAQPGAVWLLVIPVALVAIAWRSYRASIGEREQRDSLELLYGTTRILHGGNELETAIVALLTEARSTFRAAFAELILFTAEGHEHGLRTILGPDDEVESFSSVRLDPERDSLRLLAVRLGRAFLTPVLRPGERRTDRIRNRPIRDAMVAPLMGERSLIGTFVMANREGALGTFRPDELRLFYALANHAGIALENGRLGRDLQDLSELKDQLRHQALHDSLTGLGNRDLFLDRLDGALDRRGNSGAVPVVLFIDLDDFKAVNDSIGHAGGDELLRAVARQISLAIRPTDVAVRLAGDEFAVLVEDGRDIGGVIRIAERVLEAIAHPIEIDGHWANTSASVGIAATRSRSQTADELLRDADVAMYTAKARGKGRFAVFDPSLETELSERQQLRDDLTSAVGAGELCLRYQPVSDLRTGDVVSFEALLRWDHPSRGELAPPAFIALADETGLIVPIGRWVLREACRQAAAWSLEGGKPVSVSVNISVRQLLQPDFVQDVAGVLRTAGLPPARLTLEFAESQIMVEDPVVASQLRGLKALGVTLAIDGFGVGFSSVRYLGRYPVDVIKIARAVVATMGRTAEDARIAEAIVALGHSLRLQVVAEGIENPSQLERARAMHCDRAQGFYLAGPLDVRGVGRLLGLASSILPVAVAA